ncbi:MAG: hypothetical protein MUC48_07385 [Leptolyngbya sp. Prado105]|nr:hypothetical protein [Leptolyngbya sp. Prado105]
MMEPLPVDEVKEFSVRHDLAEDSIKIIKISTQKLRVVGLSKWQTKVRPARIQVFRTVQNIQRFEVASVQKRSSLSWLWIVIAVGQFWFLILSGIPVKAQCQDDVPQNWLQMSIEFMTESFRL